MTDLIIKQVAIDALEEPVMGEDDYGFGYYDKWKTDVESIKSIPPAEQPEIILCKDCGHRDKYGCCKYWKGMTFGAFAAPTDDYDFCSCAERKMEDTNEQ